MEVNVPKHVLEAEVTAVLLTPEGATVSTRQREARVTFAGFEGDRHAGVTMRSGSRTPHYPRGTEIRNNRQISIVSDEELAEVAGAMSLPDLRPEWLGANLSLRGVPNLTLLPPMTRLHFEHEAVIVVGGENRPCTIPGAAIQEAYPERPGLANLFPRVAVHKRGVVGWVERPGVIRPGDCVRVEVPEQALYSPA